MQKLRDAGIGFTITSSRPPVGMQFLVEPLGITLPIGPFNGSSMVDGQLQVITQHLIPQAAAARAIEVLDQYGVDPWIFTNDEWLIKRNDGIYVPREQSTIQHDPVIVEHFTPYLGRVCKVVGASDDITPPGQNKGTFVAAMAKRLNISLDAIATIGDMQNDLPMFKVSGLSVAMGNATNDVKAKATDLTTSNEEDGFAGAVELILRRNAGG